MDKEIDLKPTAEEISQARRAHASTLITYLLSATSQLTLQTAPLLNLISPIYFWFKNRKKSYFAKEQAKEAIYQQLLLSALFNIVPLVLGGTTLIDNTVMTFGYIAVVLYHLISLIWAQITVSNSGDFHYPFSIFQMFRDKKKMDKLQFELNKTEVSNQSEKQYRDIMLDTIKIAGQIRTLRPLIVDQEAGVKVDKILVQMDKIFENFKNDPTSQKASRQFLLYYPETTLNIIKKYITLKSSGVNTPEIQAALEKVGPSLDSVLIAFEKQYAQMLESDVMELDTEMEVMKQNLQEYNN